VDTSRTPDVEELARRRAEATGQPYMRWLEALEEGRLLAPSMALAEPDFSTLACACAIPNQFSLMAEAFYEHGKENPSSRTGFELLVEQVDDSPFSLAEWVAACEQLYGWLGHNDRQGAFSTVLGYLQCTAEYVSTTFPHEKFDDLVAEMLDAYGFEG